MPENQTSDILLEFDRLQEAANGELFPLLQARVADSVAASDRMESRLESERLLAARVRQLISDLAAISRTPLPQADRFLEELRGFAARLAHDLDDKTSSDHPCRPSWERSLVRHRESIARLERAVSVYASSQALPSMRQALMSVFSDRCLAAGWFARASEAEDRSQAIDCLTMALEIDLGLAAAWCGRGRLLTEQRKYRWAAHDLSWAVELDPKYFSAWRHLGNACRFLHDYPRALSCFEQAIKLDPRSSAAYTGRGIVRSLMGEATAAFADFNSAIELDPLNTQALNNRANELWERGEHDRALEDYNQALKINPRYVQALNNRGNLYRDLKEYDRALADFARALEVDPEHTFAFNNRGNVHADLKQYELAVSDYSRAIELDPGSANAYNNRGIIYTEMGRKEDALGDFEKAIELDPKNARAYTNRALVHTELGNTDLAISDYNVAIGLAPGDSVNHLNLAELFLVSERYQELLACLQRADPHLSEEGDRLVLCYLRSIALRMLRLDSRESDLGFERILTRVTYVGWSFDAIDVWLERALIEEVLKGEIVRLTQQLKTKTRI